jgi:hypothetical protein
MVVKWLEVDLLRDCPEVPAMSFSERFAKSGKGEMLAFPSREGISAEPSIAIDVPEFCRLNAHPSIPQSAGDRFI